MKRPVINNRLYNSFVMTKHNGTQETLAQQLAEAKADDWSLDMFCGYLMQFFDEKGLYEFIRPMWSKTNESN